MLPPPLTLARPSEDLLPQPGARGERPRGRQAALLAS